LRAKACQPNTSHNSGCPQAELKYHPASLGITCGQHKEVVCFIERDCRYKSEATQVTHDPGLASI
jgi:hypothetical protein